MNLAARHAITAETAPKAASVTRASLSPVFAFGLVSAAIARIVIQVLETRLLDPLVANAGVVVAAIVGCLASVVLRHLRARPGWRYRAWLVVPACGALVGMASQWMLLLHRPSHRFYVISQDINSNHPFAWVLVGVPFGALPALVAGALLFLALRMSSGGARAPSLDARERMLVPLAGGCAILHACALFASVGSDIPVVLFIIALALASLIEVLISDARRRAWLRRVFTHDEASFTIDREYDGEDAASVDRSLDIPLVIGGVTPDQLIVTDAPSLEGASYRVAARAPYALVGPTLEATLVPLVRRRMVVASVAGVTVVTAVIALAVMVA